MNELLNKIFLDNTLRNWLIAGGIIAFVFLFKTLLGKGLAIFIHRIIKGTWSQIEKDEFVLRVLRPLAWWLAITVSVVTLDKLNFPQALQFNLYGHRSENLVPKLGMLSIIVSFFWFLVSLVNFIAWKMEQNSRNDNNRGQEQVILFIRDLLRVFVIVLGVLTVLQMVFNKDVRTILGGLTIVGAAMALAAKESLENLIASFIIFFDKPFYVGDTVTVNNLTGMVERIGLRSTRIRTFEKTLVTIPNKQMVDSVVDNLSMRTNRRAQIKLEFSDRTTSASLQNFMDASKQLLSNNHEKITSSSVFLTEYNKNGATVFIEYFTMPFTMTEFNALKQEINLKLMRIVEGEKLTMSSNASTVNIFTNENDARSGVQGNNASA